MNEELYNKLMKYKYYFMKKYPSIDPIDIEEEMMWSIAKGYTTYDESKNVKLDTYVCHIMHNRCKYHLREEEKRKAIHNALSLDDVAYKDEKTTLYEILSIDNKREKDENERILDSYTDILNKISNFKTSLPKAQSRILELYLKGHTLKDITKELNTTHNNICLQRTKVVEKFITQYLEEFPILKEHKVVCSILNRWERKKNGKRDNEKVLS